MVLGHHVCDSTKRSNNIQIIPLRTIYFHHSRWQPVHATTALLKQVQRINLPHELLGISHPAFLQHLKPILVKH